MSGTYTWTPTPGTWFSNSPTPNSIINWTQNTPIIDAKQIEIDILKVEIDRQDDVIEDLELIIQGYRDLEIARRRAENGC